MAEFWLLRPKHGRIDAEAKLPIPPPLYRGPANPSCGRRPRKSGARRNGGSEQRWPNFRGHRMGSSWLSTVCGDTRSEIILYWFPLPQEESVRLERAAHTFLNSSNVWYRCLGCIAAGSSRSRKKASSQSIFVGRGMVGPWGLEPQTSTVSR